MTLAPLYVYTTRRTDRGDHTHRLWTGTRWLRFTAQPCVFKTSDR